MLEDSAVPNGGMRLCGRPTKSGTPCRNQIYGVGFACPTHTTDHEQQLVEAYRAGHNAGRAEGEKAARSLDASNVGRLRRRLAELEEALDAKARRHTVEGCQAVTVDGRYGYLWAGTPPLEAGERVMLPENYLSRIKHGHGPFAATVTELGTTYQGPMSQILRRA